MTDALSLIRDYTINKKEIEVRDGLVYLGDFCWDIKSKTNYMVWGSGRDGQPKAKSLKSLILFKNDKIKSQVRNGSRATLKRVAIT